jgi:hypothetical protein
MRRQIGTLLAALALATAFAASAQDANITAPVPELERMLASDPFTIVAAEISRPKAKGDITLKADVSFAGREPLRVKLRKAEPGADTFNNVPRYDLAAYELQKFYLDPAEYVVPPTALRMVPLEEFSKFSTDVKPTFPGADEVLAVLQYWLHDIMVIADVLDTAAFESDPLYARHIGQLNILTFLIEHRDSNAGNFLIGRARPGARVFSIDHGVAFASKDSDRGELWRDLRVTRLPADAIARLRKVTNEDLQARLGVLAQWQLQDGHYVAVPAGPNRSPLRGVRRSQGTLQMGLTRPEVDEVARRLRQLLAKVDAGEITTF